MDQFTLTNQPPKPKRPTKTRSTPHAYRPKPEKIAYREPEPITPDEEWFRHHCWKETRAKVADAMAQAGCSPRAMFNFENCGAECVVEFCKEENRYRVRGNYCHSRHCQPCMKAKANLLAANLRARLEANPRYKFRFVTLTLRHRREPLADQLKRLNICWKKLRARPIWKRTQKGGAAMLEIKWDAQTRQWHPHLHIVTQGNYIQSTKLSEEWLNCTGDSFVVDVRLLQQPKDAAYYVAKYVTKGTNAAVWDDPAAANEWVTATKGVRTCATFGTWRGYKLLAKPTSTSTWVAVDLLRMIAARARQGDELSIIMLDGLVEDFTYNPHKKRRRQNE